MKKLFFMMMAVFVTAGVNAQKVKNNSSNSANVYVGGGISFSSTSDETAIAIIPEIGYQMKKDLGLGVRLGYGSQGSGDSAYSIFSIKPYVRQNIYSLGQVGVILDYQLIYQNEGIKDNKTNTFGVGVAPGLALNINSKVSVVTHLGFLGYTSSKLDQEGVEAVNTFTINAKSENVGLSLYYNF